MIAELLKKSRNIRDKRAKLQAMLDERKVPYKVYFVRKGSRPGWHIVKNGYDGPHRDRIGPQFFSAQQLIKSGVLDFLREDSDARSDP